MSISGLSFPSIPADTVRAAQAVLKDGSPYWALAHAMEALFTQSGLNEWAVADGVGFLQRTTVTVLQLAEWLTDRQAAEATRTRVDWKYALHLSLNHIGFQPPELCLFRQQLLADPSAWQVFQAVMTLVKELRLWPHGDEALAQPEQAIMRICNLNQTIWIEEAMAQALDALATSRPEWLRQIALPHWYTRYTLSRPAVPAPPARDNLSALADAIGSDISYLLQALTEAEVAELAQLPEIRRLQCSWRQQGAHGQHRSSMRVSCAECVLGVCIAHGCSGYGFSSGE